MPISSVFSLVRIFLFGFEVQFIGRFGYVMCAPSPFGRDLAHIVDRSPFRRSPPRLNPVATGLPWVCADGTAVTGWLP
jgi:hypothetical protein